MGRREKRRIRERERERGKVQGNEGLIGRKTGLRKELIRGVCRKVYH